MLQADLCIPRMLASRCVKELLLRKQFVLTVLF